MEGSSNQSITKNTTPTPEAELNPQRVKALLNKLHEEFNASKTETDPIKVKEHLAKVDKIKRVLKIYHDQQKQRQGGDLAHVASGNAQSQQTSHQPAISTQSGTDSSVAMTAAATSSVQSPLVNLQPSSHSQAHAPPQDNVTSQFPQIQSPAPQRPNSASPDAQKITVEKYNQVKSVLKDLAEKVQSLTLAKERETDPTRIQAMEKTLTESRVQLQQYHKGALYMRKVLMDSGRLAANATPVSSPRPVTAATTATTTATTAATTATTTAAPPIALDISSATTHQQNSSIERITSPAPPKISNADQQSSSHPKLTLPQAIPNSSAITVNKKLPSPISNESKPTPSPTSTKPPAVTKTSSATKAPTAISQPSTANTTTTTKRPQISTNPTTTSSTNLVNSLRAFGNLPTVSTSIPDNDGRVLTKRKLNELITNLSIDQGDTKPSVDNDVEELFLDLADEFVRSVMGFSCNLAKHRKLDKLDIRDVLLNLERNWGIKVPGYMPDEIKPARRWPKKPDHKN